MDYFQISFPLADDQLKEILIAYLAETGFESFQDADGFLLAFVPKDSYDQQQVKNILQNHGIADFQQNLIAEKNWNKLWEQNFQPVVIANQCLVRAPFHKSGKKFPFELIIEPQMSFGTAHHDTTALMLELMLDIDFKGSKVLDMGSGTGILAIMARKKSAAEVWAIDNNVWAYTNSMHNIRLNKAEGIRVVEGDRQAIPDVAFDYILANINRNVLLEDIPGYSEHLKPGGKMLLSGFLEADLPEIKRKCAEKGIQLKKTILANDWVAAVFEK